MAQRVACVLLLVLGAAAHAHATRSLQQQNKKAPARQTVTTAVCKNKIPSCEAGKCTAQGANVICSQCRATYVRTNGGQHCGELSGAITLDIRTTKGCESLRPCALVPDGSRKVAGAVHMNFTLTKCCHVITTAATALQCALSAHTSAALAAAAAACSVSKASSARAACAQPGTAPNPCSVACAAPASAWKQTANPPQQILQRRV